MSKSIVPCTHIGNTAFVTKSPHKRHPEREKTLASTQVRRCNSSDAVCFSSFRLHHLIIEPCHAVYFGRRLYTERTSSRRNLNSDSVNSQPLRLFSCAQRTTFPVSRNSTGVPAAMASFIVFSTPRSLNSPVSRSFRFSKSLSSSPSLCSAMFT